MSLSPKSQAKVDKSRSAMKASFDNSKSIVGIYPSPPPRPKISGKAARTVFGFAVALVLFLIVFVIAANWGLKKPQDGSIANSTEQVKVGDKNSALTHPTPLVPSENGKADKSTLVHEVVVRNHLIREDATTADQLFAIFTRDDETTEPHVHADPLLPDSLEVVHTYEVEGKKYTFWLDRKDANGPYVVSMISVR